ncbi:MAG: carbohydrate kinase family protein [Candidatus Nanohalobium sp.]
MIGNQTGGLKNTEEFVKRAGGAPANVAVAASRLGAQTSITASVGNDAFGKFLIERMRNENVKINVEQLEEKTTLAFVSLDKQSKPEFSFYRGADEKILHDIETESDIVHLGSLPLTNQETAENILQTLENFEGKVSFDPNLRKELVDEEYIETLENVIKRTDILFAAEEEMNRLGGTDKILQKVDEVVESRGEEGALVRTVEDSFKASSPPVEPVDTTGAGDALTGAYLTFREQGKEEALRKAVHAASLSIQEKGAMSALPDKTHLKNSMKDR